MSDPLIGQTLSHYRLLSQLGEGGMGRIYRARDLHLERDVAVKVLRPDALISADHRRRFIQEAKSASALNHPHIVTVHDIDSAETPAGIVDFIAMEYVEGASLAQRITQGLAIADALRYACQIAEGLAAAHAAGIVHRDVKPANVMISGAGLPKLVDFGLAKLTADDGGEGATIEQTGDGVVLGTTAYMAPEQAEGRRVDARADVFALGALFYEMVTGVRTFQRESQVATLAAVLQGDYRPVTSVRPDIPPAVAAIITRCLERDPSARYPSAIELRDDLLACQARLVANPPLGALIRQPRVIVPIALVLLLAGTGGAWVWMREERVRQARTVSLPQLERLAADEQYLPALLLARQLQDELADDPSLAQLWNRISMPVTLRTTPEGARVSMKNYVDTSSEWIHVGMTPLVNERFPMSHLRIRIEKDGYETLEVTSAILSPELDLSLEPVDGGRRGKVRVPGGRYRVGAAPAVQLDDFWIERHEVTNRDFKTFIDQGGYQRHELWTHPFVDEGRTLTWSEAMARFKDSTGRPGPSTWEVGAYPAGHDDFPVSGVSWYEAAAYASFTGTSLPTIYHWQRAAGLGPGMGFFSEIVGLSNFNGPGAVKVASLPGVSAYGAYDMAGNVKEWSLTEAGRGQRYALGGGWGEQPYLFGHPYAHPSLDRGAKLGFRLVTYSKPLAEAVTAPVTAVARDFARERPVSSEVFKVFEELYRYTPSDLAATIDSVHETGPSHRRERVTINAAYANVKSRIPLWLLLPRNAEPPYQTLVYFPSGESLQFDSSENIHRDWRLEFVLQSGRAVAHPIYQGTYERRRSLESAGVRGGVTIQQSQDLGRSIDYLATRPDIDTSRLGYYGISYGASRSPMMLAMEPRFKAAVLLWGGFPPPQPDIIEPLNFAPRVTIPVLMVNGKNDFIFPLDAAQRPLFRSLGTPEALKRHVIFDYGHIPPKNQETIREVLDWLDRHLGPVKPARR